MQLDPTHRYAQQATPRTQRLFIGTSVMTLVFIALTIWHSWWWGLGVVAIVSFWALYSTQMKTVPVADLTDQQLLTVPMVEWRAFKQAYPTQVAKAGTRV
ncbi:hypothetical protein [Lacticaseibacillus absianus]|uniref:hypothetical protein n=1 Tax=Lacticaseibacillus absianus TaxID=2729623 RepID=UPI0015CC5409|nr:hypothetical protein [Lacticaseibacillus absianus]